MKREENVEICEKCINFKWKLKKRNMQIMQNDE